MEFANITVKVRESTKEELAELVELFKSRENRPVMLDEAIRRAVRFAKDNFNKVPSVDPTTEK